MKFFIRSIDDPNTAIQLQGRVIEIKPYGKFFVDHRHNSADSAKPFIGYVITEPRTGFYVGVTLPYSSVKEAWYGAYDRIEQVGGTTKLQQRIDEIVSCYGQLNEVPL